MGTRLAILCLALWPEFQLLPAQPNVVHHEYGKPVQYRVDRWTTEQGLPQNTVNAVFQTRDGYLWIGTRYGLARYDGARFTDFSQELVRDDESALDVHGFAEDSENHVWFNTPVGLTRYSEGKFTHFGFETALKGVAVQEIASCPAGGLWLASSGTIFRFANGQLTTLCKLQMAAGERVSELIPDAHSNLWVRISGDLPLRWLYLDVKARTNCALDQVVPGAVEVDALWPGQSKRLWLARPGELLSWNGQSLERFSAAKAWGDSRVRSLTQDREGAVWATSFSNRNRLHSFDGTTFRSFGPAEGLAQGEDVRCTTLDREGNLWMGSGSGGIYRLQRRRLVSLLSGYGSDLDEVYSVAPGKEGRVWLATAYGLVKIEGSTHTVYTNSAGSPPVNISKVRAALEHSSGELFLGLDFAGLCRLGSGDLHPVESPALGLGGRRAINSLCEASDGTLWVAAERGLLSLGASGTTLWTNGGLFANAQLFGVVCAPNGTVWTGTRTNGLWCLENKRFTSFSVRDGLLSQNAWPLRAEPDGTIWAGTPRGLNRIRNREVRSITPAQGLHHPPFYALLPDANGNYWSFGNRGIWRAKAAELHAVADGKLDEVLSILYSEADGMVSAEGNGDQQPNAAALPNGELWFPMTRGVVVVNPQTLPDNNVRPHVVIEEVAIDGKLAFKDGGYFGQSPLLERKTLHLKPGSARVVEIVFTAPGFVDSDKTRFRYRLKGYEEDWMTGISRKAMYTNLRPGKYQFEVEACNHHGYWSHGIAQFSFVLPPQFYETWWFYGIATSAVAGLFGIWHWQRLSSARKLQLLEQERAVQHERARIAKDLHDDLGANLTGIALHLDVARSECPSRGVAERIQETVTDVRDLVEHMRDVVWSLNPACDSIESFGNYLSQYAEECCASANKRCRIDLPQELPPTSLSAETRHHLLMAVKEALSNAAKHSNATEIRFGLTHSNRNLTVSVGDNGCGFDFAQQARTARELHARGRGLGLRNIESRVQALHGTMSLHTSPGNGTQLVIAIPLPH